MIKINSSRQLHDIDNKEQGIAIFGTCLSTDTKPTEYAGGSILLETDHKDGFWVYMFDEETKTWIIQNPYGGSIKECECPPVSDIISQTLARLPIASRTELGMIQIVDAGVIINDGVFSLDYDEITKQVYERLPDATKEARGLMQIGTGLEDGEGALVNLDETYVHNMINNDITNFVKDNYETIRNKIAQYTLTILPVASTTEAGIVKIGDNIKVENGIISVPEATTDTLGVVKATTTGA